RRKRRRSRKRRCESLGDPKFSRAKFERPSHPWEAERIKAENELLKKYGLKNKKELWRSQYVLRRFRQRARELQARIRTGDEPSPTSKHLHRVRQQGQIPGPRAAEGEEGPDLSGGEPSAPTPDKPEG